ncbi:hypothetical protein [Acinetobacter sp.]|uniref:hypothetical protein n=1 Tax=Acinetobacter sp. TaxID=472 RepID=UPI00388FBEEE
MTHPISNERVTWLTERAKVLDECIRISSSQAYALPQGGQREDLMVALRAFRHERVAISVEIHILLDHFQVKP